MIFAILKEYRNVKKEFFASNLETYFLEEQSLTNENNNLIKSNSKLKDTIKAQRTEIFELKNKINSIQKQQQKPWIEEKNSLQKEISKITAELEELKSKTYDIDKLRELAFSLNCEENQKTKPEYKFGDLVSNKKIIIIGGNEQ